MSTSSINRQIRRFHVVVVQWTSKKCNKKRDARAELCFWSLNLLFFWRRCCGRRLRACLHEDGRLQVGEVTFGGLPNLTCKRDYIKMRDYMDRRVTPPKRVTSLTWGPLPPCKQALSCLCSLLTVEDHLWSILGIICGTLFTGRFIERGLFSFPFK